MLDKTALDNYLQNILEQHNIAGMSVAVTDKDSIIYANGFGVESVERPQLKSTPETLYKIASVSKVFNAANTMCLLDQGLLDLDTPVKHYIPELELSKPGAADIVTLRHLLTHTAGFTDDIYKNGPRDERDLGRRVAELFPTLKMFSMPGDGVFLYSNYGFVLASYLAERVTGKTYSALVKENIIQPLGMDKTFYDIHEWCTYPISLPHKETADGSLSVIHNITSEGTRFGSGEIFSNVLELCKLERMFLRGGVADNGIRIISEKYLAQMTARQVDRKDGGWHGLGIHHRDYGSHTCYGHTGWLSAYRTNMFVCPDKGCGVVLMLNTNRDKIRDEMLATIFDMV